MTTGWWEDEATPGHAEKQRAGEQLALDHNDPDGMADRGARLRAELDALDMAKTHARAEALDVVRRLQLRRNDVAAELDRAVSEARAYGATWQQIADAVGLSRPAAWERWANQ